MPSHPIFELQYLCSLLKSITTRHKKCISFCNCIFKEIYINCISNSYFHTVVLLIAPCVLMKLIKMINTNLIILSFFGYGLVKYTILGAIPSLIFILVALTLSLSRPSELILFSVSIFKKQFFLLKW